MPRFAVAQYGPVADPAENLTILDGLAGVAVTGGAEFLLAPEGASVDFLTDPQAPQRTAEPLDGPFVRGLLEISARRGIGLAAGTFVPADDSGRVHNTLVVVQDGQLTAAYQKVHLYDAFAFMESDQVMPGESAPPVLEIGGVKVGFATCYDLRFPELFRVMVDQGAQVIALASAWVAGPLKEEHWAALLKARAIENTCYVVAADQVGRKGIGRSSGYDPLGLGLLDLGIADRAVGFVDVSVDRLDEVRQTLPALGHRRFQINAVPMTSRAEF